MAGKVLVPKELGKPLGMYSHGVVAPGGELIVVAGQVEVLQVGAAERPDCNIWPAVAVPARIAPAVAVL